MYLCVKSMLDEDNHSMFSVVLIVSNEMASCRTF